MQSTDCTNESFERDLRKFSDELKKYDVGLLYFSGGCANEVSKSQQGWFGFVRT